MGATLAPTDLLAPTDPWAMGRFLPEITWWSPSRTGRVRIAAASELASASVMAKATSFRRPRQPDGVEIRPALMAATYAAWSRAFRSAYVSEKSAIAPSNVSPVPR